MGRPGYTKCSIADVARRFKKRTDFRSSEPSMYTIASRNGWLNEVCSHMPVRSNAWSDEQLFLEAQKHRNASAFKAANSSAYETMRTRGLLSKAQYASDLTHNWTQKACEDPTREQVVEIASTYKTKMDFMRGSIEEYWYAHQNSMLAELFPND